MITRADMLDVLGRAVRESRALWVPAGGISMGRSFARVDEVLIEKPERTPVCPGTIIVFRRDAQWIAHRVLGWWLLGEGEVVYRTMGDGEWTEDDPPVRSSDCLGIVTAVRKAGVCRSLGERRARRQAAWMVFVGRLIVFVRRLRSFSG